MLTLLGAGQGQNGSAIDNRFIITVKTDNAGTSASNQFTIPTSTTGITQAFNYDIETSDGQTITGVTGSTTITFPSAGTYDIRISGSFPYMYFNNGGDRLKLLDIKNFGIYALGSTNQRDAFEGCSNMVISATDSGNFGSVTNFGGAWRNCTSLTLFPLIDTSSGVIFSNGFEQGAWTNCSSLTSFPLLDTSSGTNFQTTWIGCSSLTSFPLLDFSSATNIAFAWRNCSKLTSFPLIDTGNVTNLQSAWQVCPNLTSFPLIDTSNVTNFQSAWRDCSRLTSFPLIDTNSGTNFREAWFGCSSLTSFPLLDTSSGTDFRGSWQLCSSLTSFPLLDTSSGIDFIGAWNRCSSLTSFPANAFDTNIATNYSGAFTTTALTTQSIDDILVSLDTSGVSNGTFGQSGGQAPSATGEAAIDSLVGKGWTITVTGGYQPPQLLLDEYPNAAVAYALIYLNSSFIGNDVILVRRTSDNAQLGFTPDEITDGTLESWVGVGNDGIIITVYDQSGNSIDLTNGNAGNQPNIVVNGILNVDNLQAYWFYDGNQNANTKALSTGLNTSTGSVFCLYNSNDSSNGTILNGNTGAEALGLLQNGSGTDGNIGCGTPDVYGNGSLITPATRNNYYDSIVLNKDLVISGLNIDFSASSNWNAGISPFSYVSNSFSQSMKAKIFVAYNSDQSANRTAIESYLTSLYNVT